VGPEELALRPEPLVPRDARARRGRVLRLRLLAIQRSGPRRIRGAGCGGAGRVGIGEEPAVRRVQSGAQEPRGARRAPIGAAVQEEEEQHQGDGGEGPDPARLRRDHLRQVQGDGFPWSHMPNSRSNLGDLTGKEVIRRIGAGVRVCRRGGAWFLVP
jgi:hypothetical protein